MTLDRRRIMLGFAAAASLALWPVKGAAAEENRAIFAAARKEADGRFSAALFTIEDGDIRVVDLPARGHDIAVRPGADECVAFARRPGRFAVAFGRGRRAPLWVSAAADRHFYGHGVFSADGRLLYSTENDFVQGRGVIGVRDAAAGYRQIGEISSYGIGPHDLALLGDGRTLVVANGGIQTQPDYPRQELDLAEMRPSLAYVNSRTGELLEKHVLGVDLQALSIRHLAVGHGNRVVFGCQYRGPKQNAPPLVGFHRRGSEPVVVAAPEGVHGLMRNYVGSVACDRGGEVVAASAPRGGVVCYWDVATRRFLGHTSLADGCGLAATRHRAEFLVTSGEGWLATCHADGSVRDLAARELPVHWDNHAVLVAAA